MLALRRLATVARARSIDASRSFVSCAVLRSGHPTGPNTKIQNDGKAVYSLEDVEGPETLLSEGAKDGTIANDFDQATGLERLELLGRIKGVKVFDDAPLDSSRKGTLEHPIYVDSYEPYRYVGCTGSPAGSHEVQWLRPSVDKVGRCWECGSVYKVNYLGIEDDHHH